MVKVSVIIPAKNEADYLARCLNSLAKLDFPEGQFEVIVVDNGSTDLTPTIAGNFSCIFVSVPEAKTIAAVRNRGAAVATGDILVFLDADCTVSPDWLQQAKRYFSREDIACFGSSPVIPENPTWVEATWFLVRKSRQPVFERDWQESTNMFVPRTTFEKVGGFNEELATCEDVDLSYRLLEHGKILSDSRIIAVHHRDPKTITTFFAKERWRGRSNYQGVLLHGVKIAELPSLLLPLYVTGLLVFSLLLAGFSTWLPALISLCGAELPVAALAWTKIRNDFDPVAYWRLLFLYNVYFVARAASLLPGR